MRARDDANEGTALVSTQGTLPPTTATSFTDFHDFFVGILSVMLLVLVSRIKGGAIINHETPLERWFVG
jgi:hypothetical protein